jgi:hypothetical protein
LIACDKNGDIIKNGYVLFIDTVFKYIIIHDNLNDDVPLKTDISDSPLLMKVQNFKDFLIRLKKETFIPNELKDRDLDNLEDSLKSLMKEKYEE